MLLDLTAEEAQQDRRRFGNVLETFVFGEMLKHTTTADGDYRLMYSRDADKFEVDVVIEDGAGQLVGVEVKAAATVKDGRLARFKETGRPRGEAVQDGRAALRRHRDDAVGRRIPGRPVIDLVGRVRLCLCDLPGGMSKSGSTLIETLKSFTNAKSSFMFPLFRFTLPTRRRTPEIFHLRSQGQSQGL